MKTGSDKRTGKIPATIRQATDADCEGILACLQSAFEPFKAQYTPGAYSDTVLSRNALQHRLEEMTVLVAVHDSGEVIGTVGCKALADAEGHLRGMAVLPSWQGRGVSQDLLDCAESYLREGGCNRITVDTTEPLKPAIRFYLRNGFRATGKMEDFFGMPLHEYEKRL